MILVHPAYFAPIAQYVAIAKYDQILFEIEDNFVKQTYRNRCYIEAANGKLLLNVPIQHNKGTKTKTKNIKIDYKENWQKQHLKSLESAYKSSPFFEFYIDDLLPIFYKKETFLIDLTLKTNQLISDALELNKAFELTHFFDPQPKIADYRKLIDLKPNLPFSFNRYIQVFEQNHRFIPNLSILDLLFNEGPNAVNYLKNQTLAV
ncbi:MAG: WbqC family protein [Lutibacter sp.]